VRLTKIDVAEAHLVTAVRSLFRGEHPASVYLLAASAREILTDIGSQTGIETVLHGVSKSTGQKLGRLIGTAHEFANFMKHADKDPTAVLEKFTEVDADPVLFVACHDFSRIAKGQPIELQVYEAWWFATTYNRIADAPFRAQGLIKNCIAHFPGIRRADRATRLRLGLAAVKEASLDDGLIMEIEREVRLPVDDL
jgi:hypothetical protein